jgi:hypothetical protein
VALQFLGDTKIVDNKNDGVIIVVFVEGRK